MWVLKFFNNEIEIIPGLNNKQVIFDRNQSIDTRTNHPL